MAQESQYTYSAFISYNHRDEKFAKRLQRELESYKLPSVARKEMGREVKISVFRDKENLSLGDLHEKIKKELDESKYLIVVCSPNSAQPNIEGKHWVNAEITYFLETRSKDGIIPVIVGGEPNVGGERECFPPALRGKDIAGANLFKGHRSDRRKDFLKIVAKILGLLPDQLIQHEKEDDRRMKRLKWLKRMPLALLAAFGGLFAWDASRTVSIRYANYVDSFGLPQGRFELDKEETSQRRNVHYRFEYRGYGFGKSVHDDNDVTPVIMRKLGFYRVLRRVVQAHSSGAPTHWVHMVYGKRPAIQEFKYEQDGFNIGKKVKTILYRRKSGQLLKRLELSDTDTGKTNDYLEFFGSDAGRENRLFSATATGALSMGLVNEDDLRSQIASFLGLKNAKMTGSGGGRKSCSDVAIHKFERDDRGRIKRTLFYSTRNVPVADEEGRCGYDFDLDDAGRCIGRWDLRFDEQNEYIRDNNKKGIAGCLYEYTGRDNIKKVKYVNKFGEVVSGPYGWKVCESDFDEYDNTIMSSFYNAQNVLEPTRQGIARLRLAYDDCGNRTNLVFFGENDERKGNGGVAEICWKYDKRGNETAVRFRDSDGKLLLLQDSGVVGHDMRYDRYGRLERIVCVGLDEKPKCSNNGEAELRIKYDRRGNVLEVMRYDAEERPVVRLSDGTAGWMADYDKMGRMVCKTWLGTNTTVKGGLGPVCCHGGYAISRMEYDKSSGNLIRERWYGTSGKPVLAKNGTAGWRAKYRNGLMTCREWIDTNGAGKCSSCGEAKTTWEYDEFGNNTVERWFDQNGNSTGINNVSNIVCIKRAFDVHGNMTNECFYGISGAPAEDRYGMVRWSHKYDRNNDRTLLTGYDKKGNAFESHHRLLFVSQVPHDSSAAKVGIQANDIVCMVTHGTNTMDFSSGNVTDLEMELFLNMMAGTVEFNRVFVVARKTESGYVVEKRVLPKGETGIVYEPYAILDKDYAMLQKVLKGQNKEAK